MDPTKTERFSGNSKASNKEIAKLLDWVGKNYSQARNARARSERQWLLNLAFYFGNQNVQFQRVPQGADSFMRLVTPPAPYYRSRPVINLIKPLARREMSRLTAQKPFASVIPATGEDTDLFAAQAAEQIWESMYRNKNVAKALRRTVFWDVIAGNGFLKTWWDPDQIDEFNGMPGDICYDPITPFHLFVPDTKEPELENQPFMIHAQLRNAEQLSRAYGTQINFERTKGEELEQNLLSVLGEQEWERGKNVLTIECWVKPGIYDILPEGGMVLIAGQQVLQAFEQWPYGHNKYPVAHFRNVETGKFYADSIITDLIPLQREYNRTRGQMIEAKNRMSKPQLLAEQGSIDVTKLTSEPGLIIPYRPGFNPPRPMEISGLPSYVLDEPARIKEDMNEIAAQHETSRGDVPSGVTAATAISYLQEQDESQLSFTFDSIEEGMEKTAFLTLNYVKDYWDVQRTIKVAGVDSTFDVMTFKGSDLHNNTDIRMEAGSALPTSKAAKQAFIMDLMKFGYIDPNKGLEVMEIGGINKIYEQIQVDDRQAQRENARMSKVTQELVQQNLQEQVNKFLEQNPEAPTDETGYPMQQIPDPNDPTGQTMVMEPMDMPLIVPVNTWDNHRAHVERHNHFRKTEAFEALEEDAKQLFEAHVQGHVAAIMQGAMGALPPEATANVNPNDPEAYKESETQGTVPPDALEQPVQDQGMMDNGSASG